MRTIHFFLLGGLLISAFPVRVWSNSAPIASNVATAEPSARPPGRLVVSILWFENKTGHPQASHWRYAIESMLSNQFREIKAVRLRGEVEPARKRLGIAEGVALDADQARKIGEIIEAHHVIWGSFQHLGDEWRVTAQVLNVASGKASTDLAAASMDFFELCDDLIGRILKELNITPSDSERKKMEMPLTSSIMALEWYSKAAALQEEGKPFSEQENCARKAIAADPNFARAYLALAATFGSQGKIESSEKAVNQALKMRPDLADAHRTSGFILIHQKRYVEAEKELREALRIDPDFVEALSVLGEFYTMQKKFDDAVGVFSQAIVLEPMNASIHASLGVAYARQGDRDQALRELKKAEQLDPGHMEGLNTEQMICMAYDILGEIPLALKHYEKFAMLANKKGLNPQLVRYLEERTKMLKATLTSTFIEEPMPKIYTGQVLREELEKKLTGGELAMVVNPLAGSPEIKHWAIELTKGVDSDLAMARAIFNGLSRRINVGDSRGVRTAQEVFTACKDPNESFNCQESAKLYIALVREVGLKAFFTIVDKDYNDRSVYHACSAVFVDGKVLLVDLSYRWFGVPHKKVVIVDDMQTITSQMCEAASADLNGSLYQLVLKLQPEVPLSQFGLALALANAGEWQEARRMTEAARQVEPEHWMACLMQGLLVREDGDLAAAEDYFRKALAIKPDDANSRYCLGEALLAQLKLEKAREELRAGLQYDSDHPKAEGARRAIVLLNETLGDDTAQISEDPNVYLLRATRNFDQESYDQAIVHLNKALALDSELTEAYYRRGNIYFIKHQYEQAIVDFTKVIEQNPEHTGAYYNRGVSYRYKGQLDLAIMDLDKALEIEPDNAWIYSARGDVYNMKGQYDQAILECTRALEIDANDDDAYFNRGFSYFYKSRLDEAIVDYTRFIELNPREFKAFGARGMVYVAKGQYDRAVSDFTKAIEINPQNAESYINRGTAYSRMGEYELAIADYNKAVKLNPRIPPAYYYWRGLAYLKKGDNDLAIDDFNTTLGANGEDTKAIVGLATAVMNKGMHKLAIGLSGRAIEIDPKFAEAYAVRARACYKNEQFEECRKNMKAAQELGYEFEPAFLDSVLNPAGNKQ